VDLVNVNAPDPDVAPASLNCIDVLGPAGAADATTPVNPEPLPMYDPENDPDIPCVAIIEPVTVKLPEIIADPVYGNVGVLLPPGAQDADIANDELTEYEEVVEKEDDNTDIDDVCEFSTNELV
jgi:hypothetical protein